ncbi:uncharacterized protein LOC131066288 [Cryptomeria japonica]|uniref:uncharacterized protein LOC131066288 n=1 Tax=Cryptomeria japonica TaxID=3369 RepID=UPI0027D9F334|nr:uncharacterized protein LOC131066288 [Cryptomeria japonica]
MTEGAIVDHEILHSISQLSIMAMILKLDMMKAYDRVSWQVLLCVLKNFGFEVKWVKWIQAYISMTRFSVNLNGSPCGFFASSRGLKQGDPLSPFLFIILVEDLSRAILGARDSGLWKGISIPHMVASHSHCLFVDDTLLFGKATMGEAKVINRITLDYSSFSVQKVNRAKSKIFFLNVSPLVQSRLTYLWGFSVGQFPFVLNAVPIYLSSILKAPKKDVVALQSVLRSFLWNDNVNKKDRIPLLAWDRVCSLKDKGGAGIKDLGLSWLIHNGQKARIWGEVWNGFPAFSSLRDWTPLMSLLKSSWGIFVADYFFVDSSGLLPVARWKSIDFLSMDQDIKSAFVNELKKRPLLFFEDEDELIWTYSKSGEYSVKEGYNYLSTGCSGEDLPFKLFWHVVCLPKVGAFAWLAVQNRILTGMRLDRLGITVVFPCVMCGGSLEPMLPMTGDISKARSSLINRTEVVWLPPPSSKYKLNFDGASRGNPGKSAIGVVVSDNRACIIKGQCQCISSGTNNVVELYALSVGLDLLLSLHFLDVIIEDHCYREANRVADILANKALDEDIQSLTGPHRYYTRRRPDLQGDPTQTKEIPLEIMGDRNDDESHREAVNNEDQDARVIMRGLVTGQQQVANVLQQLTTAIQQIIVPRGHNQNQEENGSVVGRQGQE